MSGLPSGLVSIMLAKKHTLKNKSLATILIPQALSFAFPAQLKERNRKIKSEEHLGRTPPRTQKKKDSCLFPYGSHGYDTRIAQAHTHTVSTQAASLSSERPSLFHALNWSELHYSRLALSSAETHWVHFNSRALKENFCRRCVSFLCFHVDICIVALYICQSNSRVIILYLV